jgi:hypothetical protein
MRRLERYLSEGTPSLKDVAKVTASLARARGLCGGSPAQEHYPASRTCPPGGGAPGGERLADAQPANEVPRRRGWRRLERLELHMANYSTHPRLSEWQTHGHVSEASRREGDAPLRVA